MQDSGVSAEGDQPTAARSSPSATEAGRAQQDEAQGAAQMQHDLLTLMAHDLRNPLAAIKGQAEVLVMRLQRMGIAADAPVMRGAERIQRSAGRMDQLLNYLVDVALVRMNRPLELGFATTDLTRMVQHMVAEQQRLAPAHRLVFLAPAYGVAAECDAARLEHAIENVLSNATRYSPAGSTVTVTLEAQGNNAVLTVRDEGRGIHAGDLPRIFDRSQSAGSGIVPGKRLGLPVVKQIVEEHGGAVSISSHEGEGTAVVIYIPLMQGQ